MKNKLTIAAVEKALKKNLEFVDHCIKCDQRDNPQVIEMKLKATGRVDALQAVLEAMRGDTVSIQYI